MHDYYYIPALVLTALLVPAYGYLYLRYRDARTLLWLLGFLFTLGASVSFRFTGGMWGFSGVTNPWAMAAGQTLLQISSALFLASLSPLTFRAGRHRILYVIPYTLPLVVCTILFFGVFRSVEPQWPLAAIFPILGLICFGTAVFWGSDQYIMPAWLGVSASVLFGGAAFWALFALNAGWALTFVESFNLLMTALLMVFAFRRFSPGMLLSVTGLVAWSLYALEVVPAFSGNPASALSLNLVRIIVMGKVVAALGMILLTLEDELAKNTAAQERERRARRELEAYSRLMIARRRVDDFDHQGSEICEIVVEHSRFAQAALLLHGAGRYRLAGSAGLDEATARALAELATRIPSTGFLITETTPSAVDQSQTLRLDLEPWLEPGDDLKRLRFTSALAVPMTSRGAVEGALLLAGMRPVTGKAGAKDAEPLRADDLLPIELLVARLQATRNQTMMFEKLIDSEKFAHLGQLAGNVSQQLNNPLTVVLGFASLLDETSNLEVQDRRAVQSILTEARHMRTTLESLARISRPYGDELAAVSVAELLADMGELHRTEFLRRSIEFRLSIAASLPRALCSAQQLRQAVRHCLQFAMDAVDGPGPAMSEPKIVRMEAASEGGLVQILVGHSGPGFVHPERAFDPFSAPHTEGQAASLGLSLCATLMRDNNGRAIAVNFEPQGAGIVLELQAA